MTPYSLEEAIRRAQGAVQDDNRQIQNVIFHLLTTLLQHEADRTEKRMICAPTEQEWDKIMRSAWDTWKAHGLGDGSAHWIALNDALQHAIGMYQLMDQEPE
jgi:hypothetical protein